MAGYKANKSSLGRALDIGRMGAAVAGSYLGYLAQSAFLGTEARQEKLKTTNKKVGVYAREEMQTLKGPLMKIGQMLSMQSHALPEELIQELSRLQMQAPGMHPSLVRVQFKNSLGKDPEDVFLEFDPEPFAAASLGQVHRAVTYRGETAAVKIQYPGIRDAVEQDFEILKTLSLPARWSGHMTRKVLEELSTGILLETDYLNEARNIEYFQKNLAGLDFVRLPRVYGRYSTDKVLAMSFVSGRHLDQWLAQNPSQRERNRIGANLMELFHYQLLKMHAVHADPHLGNYLFDSDGTVGLVDFGCVKRLSPQYVRVFSRLFLFNESFDSDAYVQNLRDLYAASGSRPGRETIRIMREFSGLYQKMFPPDPAQEDRLVDFGSPDFLREIYEKSRRLAAHKGLLPELLFIMRAEGGLYNALHKLGAKIPSSRIVRKHLGR